MYVDGRMREALEFEGSFAGFCVVLCSELVPCC